MRAVLIIITRRSKPAVVALCGQQVDFVPEARERESRQRQMDR